MNCRHGLPKNCCAVCTAEKSHHQWHEEARATGRTIRDLDADLTRRDGYLEDTFSIEDERPRGYGGRYYPTREEEEQWDEADKLWAARCDEEDEMDTRHCPPEPDRDGRREAYYQNGTIPPFPLY